MKDSSSLIRNAACLLAALTLPHLASAGTAVWSGAGGDQNWSNGGNWTGTGAGTGGAPGAGDTVGFGNAGTSATMGTVNNLVDGSFTAALGSLTYSNTAGFHTTQIAPGQTLALSGALTANGAGTNSITGAGGTLSINTTTANWVVGSSQTLAPGLDLSGLDSLNATVKQLIIANGSGFNGALFLAKTNSFTTAAGSSGNAAAWVVGGGSSGGGGTAKLYLGQTNALFVDGIMLGSGKSGNNLLTFNPAFSQPTAFIRGIGGASSRVTKWSVGDGSVGVNSGTPGSNQTNDFSAGTLDAAVDTLIVGQGGNSTGSGKIVNGVFTMGAGKLDANTLYIGAVGGTASGCAGVGTLTVNGGTVLANTLLELAHTGTTTGGAASNSKGTLTVNNGGAVYANAIAVGTGSGATTIAVTGGTLAVTNTLGSATTSPTTLALTNSMLFLTPGSAEGLVNVYVGNLALGGANTLTVISNNLWVSFGRIAAYPTILRLIQYTTPPTGQFTLGPLPSLNGVQLTGNLQDSGTSIDLVITGGPNLNQPSTNVWKGTLSLTSPGANLDSNWSTSPADANWLAIDKSTLGTYRNFDSVIFDDSAYTNAVLLAGTLTPASVTFSNNALPYTFGGSGSLGGLARLEFDGTNSVLLSHTGVDTFLGGLTINSGAVTLDNNPDSTSSGGVAINAGTLQVGNYDGNGNLPAGGLTNNGSLLFARTNNVLVLNPISGFGSLTNLGSGTAILAGDNSYYGNTVIAAGSLQVGNGGSSGSLGLGSVYNQGTLLFNLSANATINPDISGTGSLVKNGSGRVTLNTWESYSGDTFVNAGTLALSAGGSIASSPHIFVRNATLDVSALSTGWMLGSGYLLALNSGTLAATSLAAEGANLSLSNSTFAVPVTGTLANLAATNATLRFSVSNVLSWTSIATVNLTLGTTNSITLALPAGFQSYPVQLPVIRYKNLALTDPFNVGLNNLAAGYGGYVSNNTAASSIDVVLTNGPFGAILVWSGTATPNLNWSTGGASGNWNGLLSPAPTDQVLFDSGYFPASSSTQGEINNIVDQDYTVSGLTYNNSSYQYHTTQVPAGHTLTVNGSVTVGNVTADANTTYASVVGAGTLKQTNGTLRVLNLGASGSLATWDLSGLSNFVFSSSNGIALAVGNQSGGTLALAQTNSITLLGSGGRQLQIGGNANGNSGPGGSLLLGQVNTLSLDTLYLGGTKQSGSIAFRTNLNHPTALFRGVGGDSSRVSVWSLGDVGAASISGGTPAALEATNDFTAGTVDALVDLMIVGQGVGGSGTKTTSAGLAFGAGTFDVNTLYIGAVGSQASESGIGSVEVLGGAPISSKPNLLVHNQIVLGTTNVIALGVLGNAIANVTGSYGTLTIDSGATVLAGTIVAGGTANARNGLVLNGGSLTLTSSAGAIGSTNLPLATLTLSNSTLTLPANPATPSMANTLNLLGDTNLVNVSSVAGLGSLPATIPLIMYTNQAGLYNLGLGSLPAGCTGYLTNDTTAMSVNLVITSQITGPPTIPTISQFVRSGADLVVTGTNGLPTGSYQLLSSTNVALPLAQWTAVATNQFDASGNFSLTLTNAAASGPAQQFYRLRFVP